MKPSDEKFVELKNFPIVILEEIRMEEEA